MSLEKEAEKLRDTLRSLIENNEMLRERLTNDYTKSLLKTINCQEQDINKLKKIISMFSLVTGLLIGIVAGIILFF